MLGNSSLMKWVFTYCYRELSNYINPNIIFVVADITIFTQYISYVYISTYECYIAYQNDFHPNFIHISIHCSTIPNSLVNVKLLEILHNASILTIACKPLLKLMQSVSEWWNNVTRTLNMHRSVPWILLTTPSQIILQSSYTSDSY